MFENTQKNLEARGYTVRVFPTGADAAAYLDSAIDGKTVGFGGSVTLGELGLYERLSTHNTVFWHMAPDGNGGEEARVAAGGAQIYLSSVNGLAETGEIINIDGTGNRLASTLYGHEKLYLIVGKNKLAPTYDEALWRARNIAGPKNAQRLHRRTPCAVRGDRCYDCKSPDRICHGMVVLWQAMNSMPMEIVLIGEDLGY